VPLLRVKALQTPRTQIRQYVATLLSANVDVGGRVFTNRKSRLLTEELPAVCVEYGTEPMEVRSGDKYHAKSYERALQLSIVIGVEGTLEAGQDPLQTYNAEDLLDVLGDQAEMALGYDWRLARLLPDFDPNTNYQGLADGLSIKGGATYDVSEDVERKIVAREIGVVIYYETQAFDNLRLPKFKTAHFEYGGDYEDYESQFDLWE
jgi:hypothetical protein